MPREPTTTANLCGVKLFTNPEAFLAKAADFSGETQMDFGNAGDFERGQPFTLLRAMGQARRRYGDQHPAKTRIGRDELVDDKPVRWGARSAPRTSSCAWPNCPPDEAIEVQTKDLQQMDSLRHLVIEYDGWGKAAGIKICGWQAAETTILKDHLTGDFRTTAVLEAGDQSLGTPFEGDDDLRIYTRGLSDLEVETLPLTARQRSRCWWRFCPAQEIAALQPEKPPEEAQIGMEDKAKPRKIRKRHSEKRSTQYFPQICRAGEGAKLYAQLKDQQKEKDKLEIGYDYG